MDVIAPCPYSVVTLLVTSAISVLITALLATVISVLVLAALCKYHPKFKPGSAQPISASERKGQDEYKKTGGEEDVVNHMYDTVGRGSELQKNEAYGSLKTN